MAFENISSHITGFRKSHKDLEGHGEHIGLREVYRGYALDISGLTEQEAVLIVNFVEELKKG